MIQLKNLILLIFFLVVSVILIISPLIIPPAFAAGEFSCSPCSHGNNDFSLKKFFRPAIILLDGLILDKLGIEASWAAAPDPDICGSDSVGCSGVTPTAQISWSAAPWSLGAVNCNFKNHILSVSGWGTISTALTSYNITSGLISGTTYNWNVDARYECIIGWPPLPESYTFSGLGGSNMPSGSFMAPECLDVDIKANDSDGPITIDYNTSAQLTWTSTEATSCTGNWGSNPKPTQLPSPGESTGNLTSSQTYTLTCDNPGGSVSDEVTVDVSGTPWVNIIADDTDIPYNTATNIRWNASNVDSCTVSPPGWTGISGTRSTGNLTSSITYTADCTSAGGPVSDNVTVNVGTATLSVSLSANPSSGTRPLNDVDLTATVGGSAIGSINYTFYCNRSDSGTNITPGWAAKYDGESVTTKTAVDVCDYSSVGTYSAKVIVERASLAAEDRETITVLNNPPTATNLLVAKGNYCSSPAHYFSWVYSDPDGDNQSQFRFQVDNNSNFSSPEVDQTVNDTWSDGDYNNQTVIVSTSPGSDQIGYNTTYYWRVKVWDDQGGDSGWVNGPSFTTERHRYPYVDFSWSPQEPSAGENILFADQSTVYGGTTKSSWLWTFEDGSPASSGQENPLIQFTSDGPKQVVLEVTDSNGYACQTSKTINVNIALPGWKEVLPR